MSYTPVFGAKARSQWRTLEPYLQELVLDELEGLARNPPVAPTGEHTHDFTYVSSGVKHYIFLRLRVRHLVRTITVTKLGHAAISAEPKS